MPTCHRCRRDLGIEYFQAPVSICIVCYSLIQENEGLTVEQLREKMRKSTYAKRRLQSGRWAERERLITTHDRDLARIVEQVEENARLANEEDTCDLCGRCDPDKKEWHYVGQGPDNPALYLCPDCFKKKDRPTSLTPFLEKLHAGKNVKPSS